MTPSEIVDQSDSSVLERELHCSICTDLLFDPITFLNCLHTTCGSCAKRWFAHQHSLASPTNACTLYTCPVCRKRVRKTRSNPIVVSLLEDFVKRWPDKDRRSEDEKRGMRDVYKPGDAVLPEAVARLEFGAILPAPAEWREEVDGERRPASPRRLRSPGALDGVLLQRARARAPTLARSEDEGGGGGGGGGSERYHQPPPSPSAPTRRSTSPLQHIQSAMGHVFHVQVPRRGSVPTIRMPPSPLSAPPLPGLPLPDSPPPPPPPPLLPQLRSSASPRPALSHNPSHSMDLTAPLVPPARSPSAPPTTSVLSLLQRGHQSSIIITCDSCHVRLDNSVHLECSTCPLFHLCQRCHRSGLSCPLAHPLHRQKLTPAWPRAQLTAGVFCDVCDGWCDEDRNGLTKASSMFWHCRTCNAGRWAYCMRCVARSWTCTHELTLWSNARHTPNGMGSSSRRGGGHTHPTHPLNGLPPETLLLALGYTPWTWPDDPPRACALCTLPIASTSSYTHCFSAACCGKTICTTCFYNRFRAFPSPRRALHSFLPCPTGGGGGGGVGVGVGGGGGGESMAVLAHPGRAVLHRGVFAHGPRPRPPEWILANAGEERRVAEAVTPHWPEEMVPECGNEGDRKWGKGQWLCFPVGAEVLDVVVAFEGWCWGSYAGVGGLFPRNYVRLV